MTESDTYYIDRCLDGHPDDFQFLVQRYQGALLGHLVGKLKNQEAVEEAAQETLVRAFFKMESLKEPGKFLAWLLGIANHVARETWRKQAQQQQRAEQHAPHPENHSSPYPKTATWKRPSNVCPRYSVRSYCYVTTVRCPAGGLPSISISPWGPSPNNCHGPTPNSKPSWQINTTQERR